MRGYLIIRREASGEGGGGGVYSNLATDDEQVIPITIHSMLLNRTIHLKIYGENVQNYRL